jgi:methanogenic corrinoid protein MtbC1
MAVNIENLVNGTPSPEDEQAAMAEVPVDEDLAKYVYLLGVDLLEEGGGMATLQKAVQQSSDPILVISQFIVQMMSQLVEVLNQETNFDPRVMLVSGGFVDSISAYIVNKLGLGEEAADQIEQEVLEMVKGLARGESNPANPAAAAPAPAGDPMAAQAGPAPASLEQAITGGF